MKDETEEPLTTFELRMLLNGILSNVFAANSDLTVLRDFPEYDEDYKIRKWGAQLTRERLARAQQLSEALCSVITELRKTTTREDGTR